VRRNQSSRLVSSPLRLEFRFASGFCEVFWSSSAWMMMGGRWVLGVGCCLLLTIGAAEGRSGLRRRKYRTDGRDCRNRAYWWS